MNRGRVGEERGGKETDGCPLTRVTLWYPPPSRGHLYMGGLVVGGLVL
jgi:hypothetical protein